MSPNKVCYTVTDTDDYNCYVNAIIGQRLYCFCHFSWHVRILDYVVLIYNNNRYVV